MAAYLLTLIVLFSSLTATQSNDDEMPRNCHEEDVLQCTSYYTSETSPDREGLAQSCREKVPKFLKCVESITARCEDIRRLELKGQVDAMEYVCGEGFEGYLIHSKCHHQFCPEKYPYGNNVTGLKCREMQLYLECARDQMKHSCGEVAASFWYKFQSLWYGPLHTSQECDLPTGIVGHQTDTSGQGTPVVLQGVLFGRSSSGHKAALLGAVCVMIWKIFGL